MKKLFFTLCVGLITVYASAAIDMQAHVASDDGKAAYTAYTNLQYDYYVGNYTYGKLILQRNTTLFGSLNTLMGNTCLNGNSGYDYGELRWEYVNVDKDLNKSGYIIGYYDGKSMNGTWDGGNTYNREHTWPQSKGANKKYPMGYDMQSVRPANASINSSRGNKAYGESASYYDPNTISINNTDYNKKNNGSYRGDCARVIMYDYIVYGQDGTFKNALYNGNAQLLSKLGSEGLFESIEIMLKWHMQDPPSLTEMVRNDGAEDYQGNRNPFIDYPELAILMFQDEVTTYAINTNQTLAPAYTLTTKHGFVTYLTNADGSHPTVVDVTGATSKYEAEMGRLTVTDVTGEVQITSNTPSLLDNVEQGKIDHYTANGTLYVKNLQRESVRIYDLQGRILCSAEKVTDEFSIALEKGIYILQVENKKVKVIL